MEQKKRLIMEAALTLFAEKGYHDTSIQEIADKTGIAKGSVYSFFRSKEELLMMIYKYHYQLMYDTLRETIAAQIPPRAKLEQLILFSLENVKRFSMFLALQRKEAHMHQKPEIRELVYEFRAKRFFGLRHVVAEVYGQQAEPYWNDLVTVISGMSFEFMNYAVFDRKNMDSSKVIALIMNVMDAAAAALVQKQAQPLLTMDIMHDFIRAGKIGLALEQQHLLDRLWALKETVIKLKCGSKQRVDAEQAYAVLEAEVLRGNGTGVSARAMALFLTTLGEPSMTEMAQQLLDVLDEQARSAREGEG
ncbi:TetR/AcrR family transcriptional regulator [Paenibacillus sp. 481]|uniref:TetR/AcrR family transcriptional regulator n=1 Tax=Paenibacillus sp. 481 TaxID=2835869 RepID=UPI001E3CBCD3|nr:TetR/AcrR family transcriptional regulator [Paenibacillus sp. 481]UHA74937.1 TetR/AcrR family transcriptional regulator [Paenibacillus sp. 481]